MAAMTGFAIGFVLLRGTVGAILFAAGFLVRRTQLERADRGVVTEGIVRGSRWSASTEAPGEPSGSTPSW